jgi:hypothetical protein
MNVYGLNIRFLTQGKIKLAENDLPVGFFSRSGEQQNQVG